MIKNKLDILNLMERKNELFTLDIQNYENELLRIINNSSFLVIGGAGSIGQALVKQIFQRSPKLLHVIDINENNLVELVRDIRSSFGYIMGEFKTFVIDCGSFEYELFIDSFGEYDYIFNLSAIKHVRSESDIFSLIRMIRINILNTDKTILNAIQKKSKKYFCVSSDKAANPVSMMGASKRIMEMFLMNRGQEIPISTARFANVAFSDGSLLYGFQQRLLKGHPISAPNDIKRYFITPKESGEVCLLSGLLGKNKDVFFPKLDSLKLISLDNIAIKFLEKMGYEAEICFSEQEARERFTSLVSKRKWPCYFFKSDTSGEKSFEEFFESDEEIDLETFNNIGVIKNNLNYDLKKLNSIYTFMDRLKSSNTYSKDDIVSLFSDIIPSFNHLETNKTLNNRM